jgi:hypothetical protein
MCLPARTDRHTTDMTVSPLDNVRTPYGLKPGYAEENAVRPVVKECWVWHKNYSRGGAKYIDHTITRLTQMQQTTKRSTCIYKFAGSRIQTQDDPAQNASFSYTTVYLHTASAVAQFQILHLDGPSNRRRPGSSSPRITSSRKLTTLHRPKSLSNVAGWVSRC